MSKTVRSAADHTLFMLRLKMMETCGSGHRGSSKCSRNQITLSPQPRGAVRWSSWLMCEYSIHAGVFRRKPWTRFEAQLGCRLPKECRAFLLKSNGGVPAKNFFV